MGELHAGRPHRLHGYELIVNKGIDQLIGRVLVKRRMGAGGGFRIEHDVSGFFLDALHSLLYSRAVS